MLFAVIEIVKHDLEYLLSNEDNSDCESNGGTWDHIRHVFSNRKNNKKMNRSPPNLGGGGSDCNIKGLGR